LPKLRRYRGGKKNGGPIQKGEIFIYDRRKGVKTLIGSSGRGGRKLEEKRGFNGSRKPCFPFEKPFFHVKGTKSNQRIPGTKGKKGQSTIVQKKKTFKRGCPCERHHVQRKTGLATGREGAEALSWERVFPLGGVVVEKKAVIYGKKPEKKKGSADHR